MQNFSQKPEFYNYLATILSLTGEVSNELRHIAGVLFKTYLERNFDVLKDTDKTYLKQKLIQSFTD